MSIDDRLRDGLPRSLEEVRPDVDAALGSVLRRADRHSQVRRTSIAIGLLAAAAVLAAVVLDLGGDSSRGSVGPIGPGSETRVLDSGRGTAANPLPVAPGRYAIPFIGADEDAPWGEVQVPAGWGQDRLLLATGPDLDPHLRRVELLAVDRVAPDPCEDIPAPVDGDATDVAAALSDQATVRPSSARPASLDGVPGQVVQFRVPRGLDVDRCWDGQSLRPFGMGSSYTSVFPGWTYRVWVLDVGGEPAAVLAAHGPRATPSEVAELTAIVENLRFVAPR